MKKSIHHEIYPESVSEISERVLSSLEEEEFFTKEEADYDITFRRFADFFFQKWIKGEDLEEFSSDEFTEILLFSMIESDVEKLKSKKILDSIEDENGQTLYFITENGKKLMGNYRSLFN